MEPSALRNRTKKGLLLLLIATILIVAAIVLVVASTSVIKQKPSPVELTASPQYLPYQNTSSGIYLVSATANSRAFPLSDIIPSHPDNVEPTPTPIIRTGESCFIVNATLRSDYTKENPSPNQWPNNGDNSATSQTPNEYAYVYLTAKLYDKSGQEISISDITPPFGHPNGGAILCLHNGETDHVKIYLATSRTDIDHFTVDAWYIGVIPVP
jgi:hypothetical protein